MKQPSKKTKKRRINRLAKLLKKDRPNTPGAVLERLCHYKKVSPQDILAAEQYLERLTEEAVDEAIRSSW